MRIALIVITALHGIIHLFGFLKAFDIAKFNAISQPISKLNGLLWLLAFLLFIVTVTLLISHNNLWWIFGLSAVLISQYLIFLFWNDTKFGTVINVLLLIYTVLAYSSYSFKEKVLAEKEQMRSKISFSKEGIVTKELIGDLPDIIQTWLLNCGIVGKKPIISVNLKQDLKLLMKPEQEEWSLAKAQQYFTIDPPAFNWSVDVTLNSIIRMSGRDKFENGASEMTIKLFSIFPVVNETKNKKINEAAMQRYLAEMVWFPSAAISPYITWETIDEKSAKATMTFNGTRGSGIFYFDDNGHFKKFVAMRYKDVDEPSNRIKWTVEATKTEKRNDIAVPVELNAIWTLDDGDWTWLKLKIEQIEYYN